MSDLAKKPTLSAHAVRRLTLSRYYLTLAKEHARIDREVDAFVTINLLHEAIETFLVAAADHLNAPVKPRTEFATYLDKIDEALAPARLPFRTTLIRLNKARANAKHDSIVPDRAELPTFVASTTSFLEEASDAVFEVDFGGISLVDLLDDGEVRDHLKAAQVALEEQRFADVLIECRKGLFLVFEKPFDIASFDDPKQVNALFSGFLCHAPAYARSAAYIEKQVREPFDYIVLDHSRLDSDLVKEGLDPLVFWNLWRLTPQVYRRSSGDWLIRNELDKLAPAAVCENASYVLENSVNLIHQRERKRRAVKTAGSARWHLRIQNVGANVYRKACRASEVVAVLPADIEHVGIQSGTPGLNGDGNYWRIFSLPGPQGAPWISGYVHEDDLSDA